MENQKRVAIIGGGIAGLASAHYLQNNGFQPVIYEASEELGGLGAVFQHEGVTLDKYYHVILDSDAELCELLTELGIEDRLSWRETGMGFHHGGSLYGFNTPLDVLRFGALPIFDRLRVGFGALYMTQLKRKGLDLDKVPAHEWLPRVFGERVFERIWKPLLRAKFGERLQRVPAYWVWNTLNREKNGGQEVKGYLEGGYHGFMDVLRDRIIGRGGEIHLSRAVDRIDDGGDGVHLSIEGRDESFAAAISTLPLPVLSKVAGNGLEGKIPLPNLDYQGCVNAVIISKKPLERYYWTVVVDDEIPFQGVVETTHVIPTEWTEGRHLVYVMNYCDASTPLYQRSDEVVRQQALEGLDRLYPGFDRADVEDVYVFRAPHVEPVWPIGYLDERPAPRVEGTNLYLSTTAQAYPRVTAWNTSIGLAQDTVAALAGDLR